MAIDIKELSVKVRINKNENVSKVNQMVTQQVKIDEKMIQVLVERVLNELEAKEER